MANTLIEPTNAELTIKKSRFLACVEPVNDRAQAVARVAELKRLHPAATHVCWALMAGGQSAAVDDGEPSGTAGRPMLEVLRHQDLEGVLATVVRYFGGVKLGSGGLVRAYTDVVAQALLKATVTPLRKQQTLRCQVPYPLEGLVRRTALAHGAELTDVDHGSVVTVSLKLAEADAPLLMGDLNDHGQGKLVWLRTDALAPG